MPGRVSEADRQRARSRWLTTRDLGERWGVSLEHVRGLIVAGELRALDVSRDPKKSHEYRVHPEWVDQFEARRTSGPTAA